MNNVSESSTGRWCSDENPSSTATAVEVMLPAAAWPRSRTNVVVRDMPRRTRNVAAATVTSSRSSVLRKIMRGAAFLTRRRGFANNQRPERPLRQCRDCSLIRGWMRGDLPSFCCSNRHGALFVEFSIKSGAPQTVRGGCIVAGVYESRKLSGAAASLDRAAKGYLSRILARGDMEGRPGTTLLLRDVPG